MEGWTGAFWACEPVEGIGRGSFGGAVQGQGALVRPSLHQIWCSAGGSTSQPAPAPAPDIPADDPALQEIDWGIFSVATFLVINRALQIWSSTLGLVS